MECSKSIGLLEEDKATKYIRLIVEELVKHNPKRIILFGSRARGDYKKQSDIDIAVDLELSFRQKRKIKEKIEDISGLYTVDLVFLGDVAEDFRQRVLQEGIVLYEKE